MPYPARLISQTIAAPAQAVYDFASRMDNLPQWASGLARGVTEENGEWFTESPMGRVKVAMAPRNPFGVLDHDVTLPDGSTVHNAMRVTPAGDGSVVAFVLLRLPGVTDDACDADAAHVAKDLAALKALMESPARSR